MTLPSEQAVAAQIAESLQAELQAMTALHDAVVSMFGGNWTVTKTRGADAVVVKAVAGLLTKASKTYRAVQILCASGLGTDAAVVARTLFETMVAVMFILQKSSKQRTRMFHASRGVQLLKMLAHMRRTPGLKRQATKKMLAKAEADRDTWKDQLPPGTNINRHWLAKVTWRKQSLQCAVKECTHCSTDILHRLLTSPTFETTSASINRPG